MTHEPNAPVIVGASVVQQRFDDPSRAAEAGVLMRTALENAADDAGSRALLNAANALFMPRGTWPYTNPGAIVAPWSRALRTIVSGVGVLQQNLVNRACDMVANGRAEVVLVCGGEAKYRALRSQITRIEAPDSTTTGEPDERIVASHDILTREEIARGLPVPARQYALIDTALRRHQGLSVTEHINALGELWSTFSEVAAANPDAWSRSVVDCSALINASASNPMVAWPYTKLHCSQWNVDQAAGLIICSAATADRFGVARDRWVFAHVGIETNATVPLSRRAAMHRSPAIAVAGEALQQHCGITPADIEHLDIYSCFPSAVRVQAAELGLGGDRALTMTGGMTFAGGPLNNYTLQALAKMTSVLRSDPSSRGLVTNVSGMLTSYGASVWSCSPPTQSFEAIDVSVAVADATSVAEVDAEYRGDATALTYTVAFDKGQPVQGIVIGRTPDGRRCLAASADPDLMFDMLANDWCDRGVRVDGASLLG